MVRRDWGLWKEMGLGSTIPEDSNEEIGLRAGSEGEVWVGILPRGPLCLVCKYAFIE